MRRGAGGTARRTTFNSSQFNSIQLYSILFNPLLIDFNAILEKPVCSCKSATQQTQIQINLYSAGPDNWAGRWRWGE
jgi:hypothetical protein